MAMEVGRAAVVVVGILACAWDLRTKRIPNLLTLGAAAIALIAQTANGGLSGAGASLAGYAVGLALFVPWFALGGMGAGDVKLLAAFGAWLGPVEIVWVALVSAALGGVMALILAMWTGYLKQAFINVWALAGYWRIVGLRPLPALTLNEARGPRLAYAVPMTAGALVTVWLR